jgi:hypothetical protein
VIRGRDAIALQFVGYEEIIADSRHNDASGYNGVEIGQPRYRH